MGLGIRSWDGTSGLTRRLCLTCVWLWGRSDHRDKRERERASEREGELSRVQGWCMTVLAVRAGLR